MNGPLTLMAGLLMAGLALPTIASCGYLLALTLLSWRLPLPRPSLRRLRFDVVVPACNEAEIIQANLSSLSRLDWPREQFRVLVVADNCSDRTAEIAGAAGASVLVRQDSKLRGKGYALQAAFTHSRRIGWADAVVVVDADAVVSGNLLEAFAARIEDGAAAIQAYYGVTNSTESWRTRLLTIAHGAVHELRSRARERLQVSCGIRGNGWCVTHALLDRVPYNAFSQTEDLEFGIDLALAGQRVHYASEAFANSVMESADAVASGQRRRWESGRFQLIKGRTVPLLTAAVSRRSGICLDMAFDLLVLPLSYVVLAAGLLLIAAAIASWWQASMLIWLWLALAGIASLILYVLRGWQLGGSGAAGLLDLLRVPGFIAWKTLLLLRRGHAKYKWLPTQRRRS